MSCIFRRPLLLAPVLLLAVAGCGGILPQPSPPPQLYRLTSVHDFTGDLPRVNAQLIVEQPFANAALDTDRVTLSRTATTMDYFANAAWTDHLTVLMQTMIVDSLENSGRLAAVGRDPSTLQPDFALLSEIRHFEAIYKDEGAPQIYIELGVKLVRDGDRSIVAQRVFEARAQAGANSVPAAVDGFNEASHALIRQIVPWVLQSLASARPDGSSDGARPLPAPRPASPRAKGK
jgi:cholesterol transport system auxiliary component